MATDYIQHRQIGQRRLKHADLRVKSVQKKEAFELTRDDAFVDGSQDIFDVMARNNLEQDGLKRTMSGAISLLRKAYKTIESAERKISAQSQRIRNLEDLNTTDELTGLHNRKGFEAAFKRELARTKRDHNNAGILVLIEIDNYGHVEQTHGSEAIDSCLKLVSQILSEEIRAMDIAARISDDEFVLLFTNTAADKVVDRTQQLALRLNNLSMIWHGQEIRMSASLGLKAFGPKDEPDHVLITNKKERPKE